jgi:2-dehydro-3-deoxygalactonokinase
VNAINFNTGWAAVDWGSTNVRAFLLDEGPRIVAQTRASTGSKHTSQAAYRGVLEELLAALGANPERVLLAGMVGNRAGWLEVPYCACPASIPDLAANAAALPELPHARIVPGLSCRRTSGSGDVMRGEEVQCSGAMHLEPDAASVCLPGTHCKWVRLAAGRITEFTTFCTGELFDAVRRTFCTGELFDAVRRHTLLGALIPQAQALDTEPGAGFALGLQRAAAEPGLLSALFSVRADALLGGVPQDQAADFLSGILIGSELREVRAAGMLESVLLIADGSLAVRYAAALRQSGAAVQEIASADAFVAGAALIAEQVAWD